MPQKQIARNSGVSESSLVHVTRIRLLCSADSIPMTLLSQSERNNLPQKNPNRN